MTSTSLNTALVATPQPAATVLDIGSLPLQLEDLTRERIKALPKPALQELSVLLAEMDRGIGHAREQLTAALDDLYGDAARAQLLDAGKDTGTTHLTDGDLAITVEIKKSVSWDQDELAAIAQRIASNGDDPAEYIDVKYSVSERKFAAWPETLRRPFEAARAIHDSLSLTNRRMRREARRFLLGDDLTLWCDLVGLHPDFVRFVARKAGYLADEKAHWQKVPLKVLVPTAPTEPVVSASSAPVHSITCHAHTNPPQGGLIHA